MQKQSIVVVIPVYKKFSTLSLSELGSLQQCFLILKKREIYLVGPASLNFKEYLNYARSMGINLKIKEFNSKYFRNIKGYNKLLLSKGFYDKFSLWEYILIYQLDAWIFTDQLNFWVNKNYDFVGAPLFEGFHEGKSTTFVKGLNGGFSLRAVQTSIRLIKRMKKIRFIFLVCKMISFSPVNTLKRIILLFNLKEKFYIKSIEKLQYPLLFKSINEDIYWSRFLEEIFFDFKVPDPLTASKFSYEVKPKYLYTLNDGSLPVGCHAWEKFEPEFWSAFIKI